MIILKMLKIKIKYKPPQLPSLYEAHLQLLFATCQHLWMMETVKLNFF